MNLIVLLLCLVQDRLPVPDAARLKKAETEVREVFKADYAKPSPADRKSLAVKLLQSAMETRDDPAARYVLLKECWAMAAPAADLATGLRAIDVLVYDYQVDPLPLRLTFLTEATKAAKTPEERRLLADAYLLLFDQAVVVELFELAETCVTAAAAAAKQSQNLPLIGRADARAKEFAAARKAADALKALRETLRKNPEDVPANLALGRHECFARGNWPAGLPLLVKGGEPKLSELAARDLANPSSTDEQAALGDAWWDYSEKETGDARIYVRKRAACWYLRARDGLSGLTKARADKRIAEAKGEDRSPGLVGFWTFDEGTGRTAADGSGNGGTATLQPGATWGEGISGTGLKLNGGEAFATVPDSPALNLGVDSFTAACFIKYEGSHPYRVVNKWHLEGSRGWMMDINSQTGGNSNPEEYRGKLRCRIADGSIGVELTVKPPLMPGVWTHIALVLDRPAREVRFFVNGEQVGPNQAFRQFGSISNEVPLGIGRIPPLTGGFYNGCIDNLRIYRRALSPDELRTLAERR